MTCLGIQVKTKYLNHSSRVPDIIEHVHILIWLRTINVHTDNFVSLLSNVTGVLEITHCQTVRRGEDLYALGVTPINVDMVEKSLGACPIKKNIIGLKFGFKLH